MLHDRYIQIQSSYYGLRILHHTYLGQRDSHMGIPSYFKHLLGRYPALLSPADKHTAELLLLDFNCLIYGCIRAPGLQPYTHETREAWEAAAIRAVCDYVVLLWTTAGRPGQVVLCIDGVAPMAKMRQQRLRRFKSIWLAEKEKEFGVRKPDHEVWDTNAITPGTAFMDALLVSLQRLCRARPGWSVSGADEEGEGEQKAMDWIRKQGSLEGKRIHVYGLDADLIVLCLLHCGTVAPATWRVLREKQEFGKVASAESAPFLTLDINGLMGIMFPDIERRAQHLQDYVCGMSLLGNDFLPHSLGLTIRNGGHDRLLAALDELHRAGGVLTEKANGIRVNLAGLQRIVRGFAATETADMLGGIQSKFTMRGPPPRTDAERAMLPVQNLPLEWRAEDRLWSASKGALHEDWTQRYYEEATQTDIESKCREWLVGLQWILDYYTGQRPVSAAWMYPWSHPPLWSDLALYLEGCSALPDAPKPTSAPVQPQEQLAVVLPLESWGLIRNPELRAIPARLPAYWPKTFSFESLGKRWLWECEPRIPLLTVERLRSSLQSLY